MEERKGKRSTEPKSTPKRHVAGTGKAKPKPKKRNSLTYRKASDGGYGPLNDHTISGTIDTETSGESNGPLMASAVDDNSVVLNCSTLLTPVSRNLLDRT